MSLPRRQRKLREQKPSACGLPSPWLPSQRNWYLVQEGSRSEVSLVEGGGLADRRAGRVCQKGAATGACPGGDATKGKLVGLDRENQLPDLILGLAGEVSGFSNLMDLCGFDGVVFGIRAML